MGDLQSLSTLGYNAFLIRQEIYLRRYRFLTSRSVGARVDVARKRLANAPLRCGGPSTLHSLPPP